MNNEITDDFNRKHTKYLAFSNSNKVEDKKDFTDYL